MAKRVETQVRWDWDLAPGLQSLCFASKVNLSVGISLRKGLQRLEAGATETPDTSIGQAMKRIYELLHSGHYVEVRGTPAGIFFPCVRVGPERGHVWIFVHGVVLVCFRKYEHCLRAVRTLF